MVAESAESEAIVIHIVNQFVIAQAIAAALLAVQHLATQAATVAHHAQAVVVAVLHAQVDVVAVHHAVVVVTAGVLLAQAVVLPSRPVMVPAM